MRNGTGRVDTEYQFAGEQQDAESGLLYLRARHDDPATGRFLQRDPVPSVATSPQRLNPYVYVQNTPVNLVDPSGEFAWFAVAWAAIEIGATLYDAYTTGRTLLDPHASATEKLVTTGLFAAGLLLPGGGYATAGKAGKRALTAGEAGRFANLRGRALRGDSLTPHHMPQTATNFTSKADGGALMLPHSKHALTRMFKGRGRLVARAEAGLPFR